MKRIVITALLLTSLSFIAHEIFILNVSDKVKTYTQESPLFIPDLIDSREVNHNITLILQNAKHAFFSGTKSDTKGFNQSYLGPTIRLYKGETTRIRFTNELEEPTTVHGHGLHVQGKVDGGPQGKILPDSSRIVDLPIVQEAGTSWYHPHLMGKTAEHVHAGLAGLYVIEDDNSQALPLPKNYGVNDIPLIVQDRTFIDGKMQPYTVTNAQIMDGFREETLVINGTINPYLNVPAGWVRLRVLNASNARFYRFYFTDNIPFYKIATEGGFLNKPVQITSLTMAPGERNEIMIDLTNHKSLAFMAEFLPADPEGIALENIDNIGEIDELMSTLFSPDSPVQRVLELRTNKLSQASGTLPEKLNNIAYYTETDKQVAIKRSLTLDMDMADDNGPISEQNMLSINNKPMNMKIINERIKKGDLEFWTITSEMMPHPFHVHGVSFQIISLNGSPPAEQDRGWKDTVIVTDQPTEILMRFNHIATQEYPYMYHCHILEHEDAGMMGQFTVSN